MAVALADLALLCSAAISRHRQPPTPPPNPPTLHTPPAMSAAVSKEQELLSEMSTDALMQEVQRRIECAKMPERRTIFIGPRRCTARTIRIGLADANVDQQSSKAREMTSRELSLCTAQEG